MLSKTKRNEMKKLLFTVLLMSVGLSAGDKAEKIDGQTYLFGDEKKGIAVDITKAVKLLKQECSKSNPHACYNLGEVYSKGMSEVKKDTEQAIKYYQVACDANYAEGCSGLGYTYKDNGDTEKAIDALYKSCEISKNRIACSVADRLYYSK